MINKIHDILFVPAERQGMVENPKEKRRSNFIKIAVISAVAVAVFALIAAVAIFPPISIGVGAAVLIGVASGAFTLSLLGSAIAIVASVGAYQNRESDDNEPLHNVAKEEEHKKNPKPSSPPIPKDWVEDKDTFNLLSP